MRAQRQFHSPQTKPAPPSPKPEERNERPHELTEAGTIEITISYAADGAWFGSMSTAS
jgi:hypothetical protein